MHRFSLSFVPAWFLLFSFFSFTRRPVPFINVHAKGNLRTQNSCSISLTEGRRTSQVDKLYIGDIQLYFSQNYKKKKPFWAGYLYNLQPTINYYYREKNDLTLELPDQQEKKK